MKRIIIYIHGKGGNAEEANHYRPLFTGSDVIGFDYASQNPWDAQIEFSKFFDSYSKGYDEVILIANSIGAFFAMSALAEKSISKEHSHLHSVWWKGSPDLRRNHIRVCGKTRRTPYRNGGW